MQSENKFFIFQSSFFNKEGFTVIELVIVIVLLGIMAGFAYTKLPLGLKSQAAVLEFRHAIRYAQHKAITHQFTTPAAAWGISVVGNQYTVRRADNSETAEADYVNRTLPDNSTIAPDTDVWFNGLGEPITSSGIPLGNTSITVGSTAITIYAETGYVE
jgi:prepilin-type N-terminal cleavage/methylation domain-containing protein